jgi:hypothetical protein
MIVKTRANSQAPIGSAHHRARTGQIDQQTPPNPPAPSRARLFKHQHRRNAVTDPRNNRTLRLNTPPRNQRARSSRSSRAREGSATCAGSADGGAGRERSGSAGLPTPLMALPPLLPRRCCSLGGARAHHHHHLSAFFEEGRGKATAACG